MTTKENAKAIEGKLYDMQAKCTVCGTRLKNKATLIGSFFVCESTEYTQRCYEVTKS